MTDSSDESQDAVKDTRKEAKKAKKEAKKAKKEKKLHKKRSPTSDADKADDDKIIISSHRLKKKLKKEKKRRRKESIESSHSSVSVADEPVAAVCNGAMSSSSTPSSSLAALQPRTVAEDIPTETPPPCLPFVESSAVQELTTKPANDNTTLLLFYQYVEPEWTPHFYKTVKTTVETIAKQANVCGRMRVAREGLNCTLSGTKDSIYAFCHALRAWKPHLFNLTEFKMTHDLPQKQGFGDVKLIPVTELVHYGLEGAKAPPIQKYHGVHLEPKDYHEKLAQPDTVIIDVRNHYEATIGRFAAPNSTWLDPKMRKSTEFPVWLDDPETKKALHGKNVLMYCTGGIRCERASALLKYKMDTDPDVKDLNIKGVFQLQGGIDKYFKEFPDGGYWKGKNYVFDKRFAHYPPVQHAMAVSKDSSAAPAEEEEDDDDHKPPPLQPMGKCEACSKPWDMYRGKRRCPTCGVPSLICRDCWKAHEDGSHVIDHSIRCDLCVEQKIHSKRELRDKEQRELRAYEEKLLKDGRLLPKGGTEWVATANPDCVTRLFLKNMCRNSMTDDVLLQTFPGITHVVWRTDRKTGMFLGQGWVEMESAQAAALAVERSGEKVLGRPLYVEYQPADGKDAWPPPSSAVKRE